MWQRVECCELIAHKKKWHNLESGEEENHNLERSDTKVDKVKRRKQAAVSNSASVSALPSSDVKVKNSFSATVSALLPSAAVKVQNSTSNSTSASHKDRRARLTYPQTPVITLNLAISLANLPVQ